MSLVDEGEVMPCFYQAPLSPVTTTYNTTASTIAVRTGMYTFGLEPVAA